jgi:hypothetical protein
MCLKYRNAILRNSHSHGLDFLQGLTFVLAYFIAAHKSPEQVLHLLDAIYREQDIYAIHVGRKSEAQVEEAIRGGTAGRANFHFLERQFSNWSGWSWERVELDAISNLLKRDTRWMHYINLSGQEFWRWTCCPEENFFQTLIMNSRFRDWVIADNKREIVWPGPKTFTMADYAYLKASPKFFARKFDMDVDRSILARLASMHSFAAGR